MKEYLQLESIYININNINPEPVFGGVWERIQDTFLLDCGDYASAGSIRDSKNHTHNYGIKYEGFYKGTIIEKKY